MSASGRTTELILRGESSRAKSPVPSEYLSSTVPFLSEQRHDRFQTISHAGQEPRQEELLAENLAEKKLSEHRHTSTSQTMGIISVSKKEI